MSAHQRGCVVKKQMTLQVEPSENIVIQEQIQIVTLPLTITEEVPQETIVPKKKESKKTKLTINNSTN
jgi:hypothetical protein